MMEDTEIQPIPVRVVGEEKEAPGVFGAWVKHAFTDGNGPRQILPEDTKRKRAVIVVRSETATDVVYIGSRGQTQDVAVASRSAGELVSGNVVTSESAVEQWMIPASGITGTLTVSVLVERYL